MVGNWKSRGARQDKLAIAAASIVGRAVEARPYGL
jgi:hypothetical protein